MIYLPSIVCVSQYFEKRRALATGIGVSGAGIGTFVLSPLTSLLINTYTWQGAILIQAGLVLNCLACASVYKPRQDGYAYNKAEITKPSVGDGEHQLNQDTDSEDYSQTTTGTLDSKPVSRYSTESYDSKDKMKCKSEQPLLKSTLTESTRKANGNQESENTAFPSDTSNIFLQNLKNVFDISIFKNVAYNIFLISTFLYSLGYYVPYIYLPDTAREAGRRKFNIFTDCFVGMLLKWYLCTKNNIK